MAKIINNDNKPFEWTFNGEPWGPIAPGQIVDLPDEVAQHAIKRSVVLDDAGDYVRHRVCFLSDLSKDQIKEIALYDCPLALSNQCSAKPFKSLSELKAHMDSTHFELNPEALLVGKKSSGASATK